MSLLFPSPATLFGLGTGELVVIFLIILLLFGGANLPKLTRSLGKSVKEFKGAIREDGDDEEEQTTTTTTASTETETGSQAPSPKPPSSPSE